jgi:parvulin-like peptidyl-prolyl isomerase
VSEPLETESFYAVFKLDSIIPEGTKSFEEARNEIYRDLLKDNEFEATNLFAEEIKSDVLNGSNFKSIKDKNSRVELVPSDKKKLNGSFISLGKSEQLVGALISSQKGAIIGPVKTSRGHGIVKIENIANFDSSNWEVSKEMIRNDLAGKKERETYSNWMKNLKDEADIIDNRKYHF